MIDSIVEKALNKLNKNTLEVAEHPIGIDAQVEEVLRLIDVESKDVQFVGILGIGGIGKTTIAKAVFNRISRHFEGCCFLPDVREGYSQYKGLVNLQNDLISGVLKRNNRCIKTVDEGIILIKERFCSKKVLIILDDVDEDEQLNNLAGRYNWFGPGSVIIITTREKHILRKDRVNEGKIYIPNELDVNQSLQLFSNHAFGIDQPPEDFRELSEKFLGIIGGLPLALKVVGSFLRDKEDHQEWESELQKLNKIPDPKVQGSLQISYDGLKEDEDKELFLDIACFFIGMDKEIVIHISEDNSLRIRIKVLVLKSLVRIDHNNKLRMHDLIRDMGREIVRKKSPNNLEMRCRLWSHEDAFNVLKGCKDKRNIEGLVLNFQYKEKDCSLKVEAFEKMSKLRLLQIDHAYLEGDFDHFPRELMWLSWKGLPSECIPNISHLQKLSVLDMSMGKITDDWSGWQHIQLIKTLKVLDLRNCLNLTRTPDFSRLTSLKRLILDGCKRLVVFHESIGQLKNLDFLNLESCENLVELPDNICKLSSLKSLMFNCCRKLERLPKALGSMISLTELDIGWTHIGELPDAIGSLNKLEKLSLAQCTNLVKLPEGFGRLSSLKFLDLSVIKLCSLPVSFSCLSCLQELNLVSCGLVELPEDFGRLSSLKILDLVGNKFCSLPASFSCLSGLQELNLGFCVKLRSIPELPSSLIKLDARGCSSMERLPELSNLKFLQKLDLSHCGKLSEIQGISGLPLLQTLDLSYCTTLQSLPEIQGISGLPLLQTLDLSYCTTLQSLPEIQGISCLPRLQILSLKNCKTLQSLPMLPSSLIRLEAHHCISLESLPDMSNLKILKTLELEGCNNLAEIKGLEGLESLIELNLLQCNTYINNFPKIVARGILPSASYGYGPDSWKQYLIPDYDNIKGIVFFLVLKIPKRFSYNYSYSYDFNDAIDSSDAIDSIDDIPIKIWADVTRNDGKRISCGIDIIFEGWEKTDSVDRLYSCYFQGLTWFGIPLQKGDKLKLSAHPSQPALMRSMDVRMHEFVVADEAVEDDQQLEKGVKQLIKSILKGKPRNHGCVHSPYRMPSVSGGRREC